MDFTVDLIGTYTGALLGAEPDLNDDLGGKDPELIRRCLLGIESSLFPLGLTLATARTGVYDGALPAGGLVNKMKSFENLFLFLLLQFSSSICCGKPSSL